MRSVFAFSALGSGIIDSERAAAFATIAVCLYIVGIPLPLEWDIPLLALAFIGVLAAGTRARAGAARSSPLAVAVVVFLAATGLSTLLSANMTRSLKLSAPLLPGVVLFFLIAEYFDGTRQIRRLYIAFSVVGLGVASALVSAAWWNPGIGSTRLVATAGIPIIVVPNDATFLALVSPLSLVLLYREPRGLIRGVAALSILLSVAAVCVLQSRTAVVTMVLCLGWAAAGLMGLRRALACAAAVVALGLVIDAVLGFPLVAKFGRYQGWEGTGRIPLWLAAWGMFLRSPVLGHGPHAFVLSYLSYLPWLPIDRRITPWPHNLYLEVLAEQGIVGFCALAALLASGLGAAWRVQRTGTTEVRMFGAGACAAFVGFCAAAADELTLLRVWVVVVLFTLLGVIAQLRRQRAEETCSSGRARYVLAGRLGAGRAEALDRFR